VTAQLSTEGAAPIFPTMKGERASKTSMVAEISAAAGDLGETAVTRSGACRWGGHAWRRGAAHFLAAQGIQVLDIKRHARHSSAAIDAYLEGAPVPPLRFEGLEVGPPVLPSLEIPAEHAAVDWDDPPKVVESRGLLHDVSGANPTATACGWSWFGNAGATLLKDGAPESAKRLCTVCANRRKATESDSEGTDSD
jgi:hypothetical protein